MVVFCVLTLPNTVYEEIWEVRVGGNQKEKKKQTQLVYKGEGFSTFQPGFIWDQGDLAVGGEFSHLHRFLDSTFAASFV